MADERHFGGFSSADFKFFDGGGTMTFLELYQVCKNCKTTELHVVLETVATVAT